MLPTIQLQHANNTTTQVKNETAIDQSLHHCQKDGHIPNCLAMVSLQKRKGEQNGKSVATGKVDLNSVWPSRSLI